MRRSLWSTAGFIGLIVLGCASAPPMKFTAAAAGGPYATRTQADKVEVFRADPGGRQFSQVGRIDLNYVSNTVVVELNDVLPQLKQKASEVGGDALIVREAGYEGMGQAAKPYKVKADVIRWQP